MPTIFTIARPFTELTPSCLVLPDKFLDTLYPLYTLVIVIFWLEYLLLGSHCVTLP